MAFDPGGQSRKAVALGAIAVLALLVWRVMEPGKFQSLSWLLLGFFAVRILLTRSPGADSR
jgi:hypothetical protein